MLFSGLSLTIMRLQATSLIVYMSICIIPGYGYWSTITKSSMLYMTYWFHLFGYYVFIYSGFLVLYLCLQKLQGGVTPQPQMANTTSTPMKGYQSTPVNQVRDLTGEFIFAEFLIDMFTSPLILSFQFSSQYNVEGQKNIEQMVLDFLQLPTSK